MIKIKDKFKSNDFGRIIKLNKNVNDDNVMNYLKYVSTIIEMKEIRHKNKKNENLKYEK